MLARLLQRPPPLAHPRRASDAEVYGTLHVVSFPMFLRFSLYEQWFERLRLGTVLLEDLGPCSRNTA